jgi:hypothetical protein
MTAKSAAKVKPVKVKQEELVPLDEMFKDAKDMFIMTVDTNILTAKRIDNLMNIRDLAIKFWGDGHAKAHDLSYLKELQKLSVHTYERIKEVAEAFELEEFCKQDMKDYFDEIIPTPEDIEDEHELIRAALIFLTVRPYGEKMLKMHQLILDEAGKRKLLEEE